MSLGRQVADSVRGTAAAFSHGRTRGLEKRLIWILGSPRSGSTWLVNLLAADRRVIQIDEPLLGTHLGVPMFGLLGVPPERLSANALRLVDVRRDVPSYFFSKSYERSWRGPLRRLILARLGAEARAKAAARSIRNPVIAIKEPGGSLGADVLMQVMPGSRMIFLLRDGRDVVDSELDAMRPGGWVSSLLHGYASPDADRLNFVNLQSHAWLTRTCAVERAFAAHDPGRRVLVQYEALRAEPAKELFRILDALELDLARDEIRSAVAATQFENIPKSRRGPGKFARSATPGLWRDNLTPDEQRRMEEVMGPKLRQYGYS